VALTALRQIPTLHYGDTAAGTLENNRSPQTYFFAGRAGDVIVVDMVSLPGSAIDPALALLDGDGHLLAENDDSGWNTNARLGPLRLVADGRYQIVAASYAGGGDFLLHLTDTDEMTPISLEKPLRVELSPAQQVVYLRYDSPSADILRLSALGETAPLLSIFTLEGALMGSSAYSQPGNADPLLTEAGAVYVIALDIPYVRAGLGFGVDVRLGYSAIELLQSPSVTRGEIGAGVAVHYFLAQRGQRVRLRLARLDDSVSPSVYVRSVDGAHFLFSTSASSASDYTVTLHIPADALYAIEISDGSYSGAVGGYRLQFAILP